MPACGRPGPGCPPGRGALAVRLLQLVRLEALRAFGPRVGNTAIFADQIKSVRVSRICLARLIVDAIHHGRYATEIEVGDAGRGYRIAFFVGQWLLDENAKARAFTVDRMRLADIYQIEFDVLTISLIEAFQLTS